MLKNITQVWPDKVPGRLVGGKFAPPNHNCYTNNSSLSQLSEAMSLLISDISLSKMKNSPTQDVQGCQLILLTSSC